MVGHAWSVGVVHTHTRYHLPLDEQDVAAIQQDMPTPLDFNKELVTVGGWRHGPGGSSCLGPAGCAGHARHQSSSSMILDASPPAP